VNAQAEKITPVPEKLAYPVVRVHVPAEIKKKYAHWKICVTI